MGISIAVPSLDIHQVQFGQNMIGTEMPTGEVFWRKLGHALAIDKARNRFVREYLKMKEPKTDHLWFVDYDMAWHPKSLVRLWERNLDIVAALTWTNAVPPNPTIWDDEREVDGKFYYQPQILETLEWMAAHEHKFESNDPVVLPQTETDLREVPVTGASFVLIKRHVFEAIEGPWFEGDENGFGEDFDFYRKARAAGFKVFVDRSVIVTHMPRYALGPTTFFAFAQLFRELTPEEAEEFLKKLETQR